MSVSADVTRSAKKEKKKSAIVPTGASSRNRYLANPTALPIYGDASARPSVIRVTCQRYLSTVVYNRWKNHDEGGSRSS